MRMLTRKLYDGTAVPLVLADITEKLIRELKEADAEAFRDFYSCCCHPQLSLANRHFEIVRSLNLIGADWRIQPNVAIIVQNATVKGPDGELVIRRPYDPTLPANL